jgi:hypothetical protein
LNEIHKRFFTRKHSTKKKEKEKKEYKGKHVINPFLMVKYMDD